MNPEQGSGHIGRCVRPRKAGWQNLIRAFIFKSVAAPFGELDGKITTKLKRLAGIFREASFKVKPSTDIVDFQMTSATGVALIAKLTIKHRYDASALAHSAVDLKLFIEARHEAHNVLRALGHRFVPRSETIIGSIPIFLQVVGLRALLSSKLGEVGLAWYCSQAPDEMHQLALELQALADQAGIPVPAIRKVMERD